MRRNHYSCHFGVTDAHDIWIRGTAGNEKRNWIVVVAPGVSGGGGGGGAVQESLLIHTTRGAVERIQPARGCVFAR